MRRPVLTLALAAPLVACSAFLGLDGAEDPSNVFPSTPGADAGDAGEGGALSTALEAAHDVATGTQRPGPLLVDATHLYWLALTSGTAKGALMRVAKTGGTPELLVGDLTGAQALVSDATSVFFSENHTPEGGGLFNLLGHQSKAGGPPAFQQVNANDALYALALGGSLLYYSSRANGGSVVSIESNDSLDLGTQREITKNAGTLRSLAVDATHVYAGGVDRVLRIDKRTQESVTFATAGEQVNAIAMDETTVYWAEASTVRRLDKASAGAPPVDVAVAQAGASALALDDATIYWTSTRDGAVRRAPKAGGAPTTTLATGEGEPYGIAVDASGVYWTNRSDGRIRGARRGP